MDLGDGGHREPPNTMSAAYQRAVALAPAILEALSQGTSLNQMVDAMNVPITVLLKVIKQAKTGNLPSRPRPPLPPPPPTRFQLLCRSFVQRPKPAPPPSRPLGKHLPRQWIILWPPHLTPHSACIHDGPLPPGEPVYCPVCEQSGWDEHFELALRPKEQRQVELARIWAERQEAKKLTGGKGKVQTPAAARWEAYERVRPRTEKGTPMFSFRAPWQRRA